MVGDSPWTSDELAELLGCRRNHTTARIEAFLEVAEAVLLARPTALAASGRADRVAEKAMAFLRTGGRLASADPDGLKAMLRQVASAKQSASAASRPSR